MQVGLWGVFDGIVKTESVRFKLHYIIKKLVYCQINCLLLDETEVKVFLNKIVII